MLHDLGWQSLDGRRQDQCLVFFFTKLLTDSRRLKRRTSSRLTPADSRTRKNHNFKFKHLQANCDSYWFSFFLATISSWNNLPFGIEKVDSVEVLRVTSEYQSFYYMILRDYIHSSLSSKFFPFRAHMTVISLH